MSNKKIILNTETIEAANTYHHEKSESQTKLKLNEIEVKILDDKEDKEKELKKIDSFRFNHKVNKEKKNDNSIAINNKSNVKEKIQTNELQLDSNFCLECLIDIPLRSKHCKICGKCIATFDHHCYWIANCIGERNKRLFLVFLFIHFTELILCIFIVNYII